MPSQNGQDVVPRTGGSSCWEYPSWRLIPSPRSASVVYWQDGTAQVTVFHTSVEGERHLWIALDNTEKIDKLLKVIKGNL